MILALFFFWQLPDLGFAACYQVAPSDILLQWRAFKTAHKIAVDGEFTNLKINGEARGDSYQNILNKTSLEIATNQVETKMAQRNQTIAKYFFKDMVIKARTNSMSAKVLNIDIEMNGKRQTIPLLYKIENDKLSAQGFLDILDFALGERLSELTNVCKALHEGKTWNDIELNLEILFKRCAP